MAAKPNKKLRMSAVRKYGFLTALFIVPFVHFAIFWVYLNIYGIQLAFQVQLADRTVVWSLANFQSLFLSISNPGSTFWLALKNTSLYWFTMSVAVYILALFIAFFMFKKIRGYKAYRFIFYVPSLLAPTILVVIFQQTIALNGPVGKLFEILNIKHVPFLGSQKYAIWTCLFYSAFFGFGASLLILSGAMSQVNAELIDAAKIDGAGLFTEMFRIVIPIVWPTVSASLIASIAGFFSASGPILLLTGGNFGTRTISFWIWEQTMDGAYNYPAAIGLFFALLSLPLVFFSRWLMKRMVASAANEEAQG